MLGDRAECTNSRFTVTELGLAILFMGILVVLDRRRRDMMTEQVRRFLDWLEKTS